MFTLLFFILFMIVFGNLIRLAFRLTWGIFKVVGALIIVPAILIGMFAVGMVYIALPVVVMIGVGELIEGA